MSNIENKKKQALELLKIHYGFERLRHGQEKAIFNVLEGKSTLVIMPTGGGKSLCYQLPALVFDGITIVISPLIALMKDQVDSLTKVGIPAA
ncbi:MAG: DEAD/DEAH box helicase, partial [Patescibacteria group bacterium]